jgi:glycerol-3-phosphate acyltransferase PlsX
VPPAPEARVTGHPMYVAVDAMGGDHAPRVIVEGAIEAARVPGIGVILVGAEAPIRDGLALVPDLSQLDIQVVSAAEAVEMGEAPVQALRHKRRASIRVATDLLASGDAAALFSAGNTGATVLAARSALGLLDGAERPALATAVPTRRGAAVLLDVGANADCRPQHLVTFAIMGSVYARVVLGVEAPRVGLLSIGEEASKGNVLVRKAHRLLKETGLPFFGNVEARDLYVGEATVVVCDGFTGNVALKVSEAMVEMIEAMMREGGATCGPSTYFSRRLDASEYGGAPLLGVAGPCVVGHGRSSARAVRNGIVLAHRFATEGLVPRIEAELQRSRGVSL